MLRRSALSHVPRGRRSLAGLGSAIEETGVGFDGRLRICAVDPERGERVALVRRKLVKPRLALRSRRHVRSPAPRICTQPRSQMGSDRCRVPSRRSRRPRCGAQESRSVVSPDADASAAIGENLMRGSARGAVIQAGFTHGGVLARTISSDEEPG